MTKTIIFLPEPDEWLDAIPYTFMLSLANHQPAFSKLWSWYLRNSTRMDAKITSYECLRELRLTMPRKGKSNGTASNNGANNRSGAGGGTKWQWGNCKLSDQDIAHLNEDTSSLEYLASCLASLGNDGYGFTCKPVDKGESHCCTIFRPDYPTDGHTVGVSAFAGNIRDAILSCLYKLDNYGGGDFTGFDLEDQAAGSRPRFR